MSLTNKTYEPMTREVAHASFRAFEREIDMKVKHGVLPIEKARKMLENSRKNYRNLNYNRQVDKVLKGMT